jgi:hypothetical protein
MVPQECEKNWHSFFVLKISNTWGYFVAAAKGVTINRYDKEVLFMTKTKWV